MTVISDNRKKKTPRQKAAEKRAQTWKPGQSGNPKGAPPRGASMTEAYKWAVELTPEVVSDVLSINGGNDLARQFKQMPRGIQIKLLVALRVISAIMFEPQASLVNGFLDRLDGPVTEKHEHSGEINLISVSLKDNASQSRD